MACRVQDKTFNDVLELLVAEGFEGMADVMSIMLNEAMRLDRTRHLGAGPWERVRLTLGLGTKATSLEMAVPAHPCAHGIPYILCIISSGVCPAVDCDAVVVLQ